MLEVYDVVEPDNEVPVVFKAPSTDSAVVTDLTEDDVIYVDPKAPENDSAPDGWRYVEYRPTPTAKGDPGWLKGKFIGPAHDLKMNPVSEEEFVHACARAEIASGAGGARPVLADYLIALATIESELTKFENRLPGTSSSGPFQITKEEWEEFLDANPKSSYMPFQFYQALANIAAAQYLTQRDWKALEDEASGAGIVEPEQTYVPSFLLLFQSRIIGAKAAFTINQIHATGEAQTPIKEALNPFFPDEGMLSALMDRRRRYLRQSSSDGETTVDEFVERTASILDDAFKVAFTKLKTNFPEFALPPIPESNAWLGTAILEQKLWTQPGMDEESNPGRSRIAEYFQATEYHPDGVEPWCGAFAAWCMKQVGAPVVGGAATAKHWETWGEVELRKGGLSDPKVNGALKGAVVVLHPAKGTGSSGHVCFAINRVGPDKVNCIGGNQSDTVRTDPFKISRIASIRALVPVELPTGNDRIILARTIYGEARDEPEDGQRAVGEVIMNRVASNRYPDSVSGVCLQSKQFSCWNLNDVNRSKIISLKPGNGNSRFDSCYSIAGEILAGNRSQLSTDVLHYYSDRISAPSWVTKSPNANMEKKIGHHLFYNGIA